MALSDFCAAVNAFNCNNILTQLLMEDSGVYIPNMVISITCFFQMKVNMINLEIVED